MFSLPTPLPDDPAALQLILRAAAAEIERLRLLLANLRRNRFGRRSERLDDEQLEQGIDDLEQSLAEQQAGLDAALSPTEHQVPDPAPAPRSPRRNRGALPAHLPRVEMVIEPNETACPCCGGSLHVIGRTARRYSIRCRPNCA